MVDVIDEVKVIRFKGDDLPVIRMLDTNKLYVSIGSVCRNLGLGDSRVRAQRNKVNSDPVLIKGRKVIRIPTRGGLQDSLCIEINFLPIWLAKINASILLDEDIKKKLIQYQLEAKDVLTAFFSDKEIPAPRVVVREVERKAVSLNVQELSGDMQALVMLVNSLANTQLEQKKQAEDIDNVKKEIKGIRDVYTLGIDSLWREKTNGIINNICRNLKDYKIPKERIYEKFAERAHCNLDLKLKRMKGRAELNGMPLSQVVKINKLDVIGTDNRLKAIYIQIVKEFAIFHGYTLEDVETIEVN